MKRIAKVFGIVFFWSAILFLFGIAGGIDAGTISMTRALILIGVAFIAIAKAIDVLEYGCNDED